MSRSQQVTSSGTLVMYSALRPRPIKIRSLISRTRSPKYRQFTSAILPRLVYSNPEIKFHVDRKPSSRTKAKDPEIVERAKKAGEEESGSKEKAERRTPRLTIEFSECRLCGCCTHRI